MIPLSSPGDAGDTGLGPWRAGHLRQAMPWPGASSCWAAHCSECPVGLLLRAHPSETCGPFRGLETIYESGKRWVLVLEKSNPNITWFTWVYQNLLENTSLLFFMSVALM